MGFDIDSASKIIAIITGIFVIAGTIFGVIIALRLSAQSAATKASTAEATAKDAKLIALAAEKSVIEVAKDLAKFREEAAREFVTGEAIRSIEGRIEAVGREMRDGLDDIRKSMIEFFSRRTTPASRSRSDT
jgi:uncharacterized membrane-anchored protein